MGKDKPTLRQLEFLRDLGVKKKPKTKDEASTLIDQTLKTAKATAQQLEYLDQLGHEGEVTSFKQARIIIGNIENSCLDVLANIFPMLTNSSVVPRNIKRDLVCALRASPGVWAKIKNNATIEATEIKQIVEDAVGEDVTRLLSKRGDATIEKFEERFDSASAYLSDFCETHNVSIPEDSMPEIMFDLWAQGLGTKMASAYDKASDDFFDFEEVFTRSNELNRSLAKRFSVVIKEPASKGKSANKKQKNKGGCGKLIFVLIVIGFIIFVVKYAINAFS